ncbi:Rha family transcriptional regulator [Arsenophonus sp. PmNCSU2021_1]|uniref:Rha family transcriptional regulator n=1 Tax=Arsenophonus sp. PmNCSU2021_1 TaxID=3118989 RepID=UPI002FF42A42
MTLQISAIPPKVTVHNGKAITTSQNVADYFAKLHKNVIRSIQLLDCSPEFNRLNFEPVNYIDSKGEKRLMYEMTKDGFFFLGMGFTGKKAAQFKEAYIAEFNRMEAELIARRYRSINNLSSSEDLIALVDKLQKVIHEGEFIPSGQTIHEYNLPKTGKTLSNIINDFINYPKKDTLHILLAWLKKDGHNVEEAERVLEYIRTEMKNITLAIAKLRTHAQYIEHVVSQL